MPMHTYGITQIIPLDTLLVDMKKMPSLNEIPDDYITQMYTSIKNNAFISNYRRDKIDQYVCGTHITTAYWRDISFRGRANNKKLEPSLSDLQELYNIQNTQNKELSGCIADYKNANASLMQYYAWTVYSSFSSIFETNSITSIYLMRVLIGTTLTLMN